MPRRSQQAEITARVQEYLQLAEAHAPDEHPLDVKSVAAALGVSRTTLYKYKLDDVITAAEQRQRENGHISSKALERRAYDDILADMRQQLAQAQERDKHLTACINLVEANAARLGIDPEELYKPMVKPNRTLSFAGRAANTKKKWR